MKRWHLPAGALALALAGAVALAYFNPQSRSESARPTSEPSSPAPFETAASTGAEAQCATCHAAIVETYRQHGMARSIGAAGEVPTGSITNPVTKARYEITSGEGAFWLTGTAGNGGRRRQRIVGRIGAGVFDTSWATTEVDPATGVATGRLFFAPVETLTDSGLQLSPFEGHDRSPGLDMPLTVDCLTCHTLDRPGAAGAMPFPAHQLGADAFASLRPLSCGACHGDVDRHAEIMSGRLKASGEGLGLARLGRLEPAAQRDVCARCHLQGDARIDLVAGTQDRSRPLAAQIPVLVPKRAHTDFRFVGQSERLALSACFKESPGMTCTTCHDPHTAARAQGVQSFERACLSCHTQLPSHSAADAATGCISCHVRKSQPFDLPHVRTADHFIRRRIEPPQEMPHRQFTAREGELMLFDADRLEPQLETAAGRRWLGGVMAMGLLTMGRFDEAARYMEAFPPPGSPAARVATAPEGLAPLETSAAFHTVRGFVLMSRGKIDAATAAFSDAIAIDPNAADARLARARLRLDAGDIRTATVDTEAVIRTYPQAEQPWDLRIEIAQRSGRADLALSAADASTRLWPSNPRTWAIVAALANQRGQADRARQAAERARTLDPGSVNR